MSTSSSSTTSPPGSEHTTSAGSTEGTYQRRGFDGVRRRAPLLVAAALFVIAFALAWRAMPSGAVYQNDSATYIGVARNLGEGQGITSPFAHEMSGLSPNEAAASVGRQPLTTWPPLYSIALASGSPAGLTAESMARLINALSLGVATMTIALLVRRLGGSLALGAAVAVLFLVNLQTIATFDQIASEPLYLALQSAALLTLTSFGARLDRRRLAVFIGFAVAASLTRIVGLSLAPVGAIAILAMTTEPMKVRVRWAAITAFAVIAPLLAWLVVARRQPGYRGGLHYSSRWAELSDSARTVGEWFVPDTHLKGAWIVAAAIGLPVLVALAIVGFVSTRATASNGEQTRRPALVLLAHLVVYEMVALFSSFFVDRAIPVGHRLLVPVAPAFLVLLSVGLARVARRVGTMTTTPARVVLPVVLSVALVVSIVAAGKDTYDRAIAPNVPGAWAPVAVTRSTDLLRSLPSETLVFTNQPSAAYILTRQRALALPARQVKTTLEPNPRFDRDVNELVELLRTRRAVVAYERDAAFFDDHGTVTEAELCARVPLEVLVEDERFVVLAPAATDSP